MSGWDGHQQAAAVAGIELQELLNALLLAKGKQEQAIGSVIMATGESPAVESSRNALECTVAVADDIDRAVGLVTTALAEISRYANGF